MRAVISGAAAVVVIGLGVVLMISGRGLVEKDKAREAAAAREIEQPVQEPAPVPVPKAAASSHNELARPVAPAVVAPPPLDAAVLERVSPREPLSPLSQALPPPPVLPDDWKGTVLYRPVASAAGLFQAMGYTVAVAGTTTIGPDETCTFEGKSWACGIRARTAFRSLLRGRALNCAVPPEADRNAVAAPCRIGKQDVGTWLVANGWARAAQSGPYAEAEAKAREKRLGIYGPPPAAN